MLIYPYVDYNRHNIERQHKPQINSKRIETVLTLRPYNSPNLQVTAVVKIKAYGIILWLIATSSWASNPLWLEGKTAERHDITVYRNASCGCCNGWISHLKDHNFVVKDVAVDDVNKFKQQFDVPTQAASCHTAVVDGVVIEGHVPAQDIKRLLADKGDVRLLTVPAMPSGTPGMDPAGARKDDFRVYAISTDNRVDVFQTYTNY